MSTSRAEPRLPFSDLERWITTEYGPDPIVMAGEANNRERWQQTDGRIATVCHTSRETIARWRRDGVPERSADRLCGPLGVHYGDVWPALMMAVA